MNIHLTLRSLLYLIIGGLWIVGCGPSKPADIVSAEAQLPDEIDYNYHVKPILSDRCFACHGPDENTQEAGLRLDIREYATAELPESEGSYAIVPGNLRKSQVFHRIVSENTEEMMPPPESNLTLTAEEKAILLKWINQGAEYKEHWAFITPQKVSLKPDRKDEWSRNGVDPFIRKELLQAGLSPSEEASKETLIRRVTFDITGLPPTIEAVDAFMSDESSDAYEKVVDRLLSTEAYGERMAAEWMDVARYADSHGYQDDGMRNMWPWRDWVIESFNDNLPFDEFITWQIAGDMLPEPTREQILATGFNRNHMQSQEGGIVPEEYRVEYVADRTNTLGTAFMGLTLQCARCHDHKYDPISQKEYYQLFGFFNNINESGVIPYAGEASPTVILPSEEAEKRLNELSGEIAQYEASLDVADASYDDGFASWLEVQQAAPASIEVPRPVGYYPLDAVNDFKLADRIIRSKPASIQGDREFPPDVIEGKFGKAVLLNGESWVDMEKDRFYFEHNDPFTLSVWFNIQDDSTHGPLIGKSSGLFDGNRGYHTLLHEDGTISASLNHVAPDHSIEIRSLNPVEIESWNHLVFTYDGSSSAEGLRLYLNGEPMDTKVVVDNLQKSILHTYNLYKGEQVNWAGPGSLRIGMLGPNQTRTEDVAFDEVTVYDVSLTELEVSTLHGVDDVLSKALSGSDRNEKALRAHYVERFAPAYKEATQTVRRLRAEAIKILTPQQEVMVMRERAEARPTFVLARGLYDAREEEVSAGFPDVLPRPGEEVPKNRLGLAEWLTDPSHPLTSRVIVNRYWQMLFGRGLVATPEDFGSQGALPSHPELLDWLAVHFVESGWDVKAFVKLLVMSATYRQSSVATPELLEQDPENIFLARAPSYRMTAEMIRDNALAASGLLVPTIGGPSVHPYQPAGLWKELATRNETEYNQGEGDELYRRSMYTIWKRSTPPPSMISFDASERNECVVQRQKTSTPLQALVLLNDPQYVEASRSLAERMMKEGGAALRDQITYGFRLLTSRYPLDNEIEMLMTLYEEEHAHFEEHPSDAEELLGVGEYLADASLSQGDLAAGTIVASTIMNFDEAYIKR